MDLYDYQDLDEKIRIAFFSSRIGKGSKTNSVGQCDHLGYLVKDGLHNEYGQNSQRIKCTKCQKRFGNNVDEWRLWIYQNKIKNLLYELFLDKNLQISCSKKWQIPKDKVSRFKKMLVNRIFAQHPHLLQIPITPLPNGVMGADETSNGTMQNSNTEIIITSAKFKVLATEIAVPKALGPSVKKAFNQIPEKDMKRLKMLICDGEPSYKEIAMQSGGKVILVEQLHARSLLGKIIINKYDCLGPHHLHYEIKTHWKAFCKGTHLLRFKWAIRLVKGKVQTKRGRPVKNSQKSNLTLPKWRQKLASFQSPSFQKSGTGQIFVNFQSNKLSMRAGAKQWMIRMLTPVFKFFKGKHITSNLNESKNSQVKRAGAKRKQPDDEYSHQLFQLSAFIAENKYLPEVQLEGRPLYRYLMKDVYTTKILGYKIQKSDASFVQTVISDFL